MLELTPQQFGLLEERAEESLRALALPLRPEILVRLTEETRSHTARAEGWGRLVAEDGATAGILIHAINSLLPPQRPPARSAHEAFAYLGARQTARLLGSLLRRQAFGHAPCEAAAEIQRGGMRLALALGFLGGALGIVAHDQAHTFGLLRDLGQAVLACRHSLYAQSMAEVGSADAAAWIEHEKRHFGADHAVIGGVLARKWLLPEAMSEAILWHHAEFVLTLDVPPIRPEAVRLIALGIIGDRVLRHYAAQEPYLHRSGAIEDALRSLGTTERALAQMETEVCALLAAADGRAMPTMRLQPLRA